MISRLGILLLVAVLGTAAPAFASLGANESSALADGRTLSAEHQKMPANGNYSDHVLSTTTMNIHEYAAADGTVFAVSWRGARRPDLSVLFGQYYGEYSAAKGLIKKGHGRQFTTVRSANVIVSSGGHMRDLRGKAYIPSLVPLGVDVGGLP